MKDAKEGFVPLNELPDFKHTPDPPPRPFPYYPPSPTEEEMKRLELMMELNKWANNDPEIAQRAAETLILLLGKQFNVNVTVMKIETKCGRV